MLTRTNTAKADGKLPQRSKPKLALGKGFSPLAYGKRGPNKISDSDKANKHRPKDPELQVVIGYIMESGLKSEKIAELATDLGWPIGKMLVNSWLYGNTFRPQNYSLTAVMLALGFKREWIKAG